MPLPVRLAVTRKLPVALLAMTSPQVARISSLPSPASAVSTAVIGQKSTPSFTVVSTIYGSASCLRLTSRVIVASGHCASIPLTSISTVRARFSPCLPRSMEVSLSALYNYFTSVSVELVSSVLVSDVLISFAVHSAGTAGGSQPGCEVCACWQV